MKGRLSQTLAILYTGCLLNSGLTQARRPDDKMCYRRRITSLKTGFMA